MASIASVLDTLAPPTGSFRVRAPVTLEDDSSSSFSSSSSSSSSDIEYNSAKDRNFNRNSGNAGGNIGIRSSSISSVEDESEYEDFEFGGEEFETASEKASVGGPDDENSWESGFVGKDHNFRPFVGEGDPDEETLEEDDNGVTKESRSPRVELLGKNLEQSRPIAHLSMDDDEFDELVDEEGTESEVDDGRLLTVVRIPSIGVLERVDIVPRVKVLGVEGDDEVDLLVGEDSYSVTKSELSVRPLNDSLVFDDCSQVESAVVVVNGSAEDSVSVQVVDAHDKPFGEYKKDVAVKTPDLFEKAECALDDSGASGFNEGEVHATTVENQVGSLEASEDAVEENGELAVDESVETYGQHPQECGVEVEGVKADEPMNCHGSEVGSVVGGVLSQKVGDGETLEGESMLVKSKLEGSTVQRNEIQGTDDARFGDLADIASSRGESTFLCIGDKMDDGEEKAETGGCKSLQSDKDSKEITFGVSETTSRCISEMERMSSIYSLPEAESFDDHEPSTNGQIVGDKDHVVDTDNKKEGKASFETATVKKLFLKAAAGVQANGGSFSVTSSDGSKVDHPADSGSSFHNSKPVSVSGMMDSLSKDEKKIMEEIHHIRVKFLRLVQRLGHSAEDSTVAQVLHRMVLAAGGHASQEFNLEFGNRLAKELDAKGTDELEFSLNVLVLGKTGVGKSATINSIFREKKVFVNAFEPGTNRIKEIAGTINGVRFRVLDTPGLRSNMMEEAFNQKVLASIKKFVNKHPPDVVLYVDRLDAWAGGVNDLSLLRSLTNSLTPSIWRNAIIVLTHAASRLPEGPSGSPLHFEVLVAQRSHAIQLAISQAISDLCFMCPSIPVSLVENHPSSMKNDNGDILLPNGQNWRSQLLLFCYSLKILAEASSLRKSTDLFDHKKLFGFRPRSLPLPHLVSSLLQSRPPSKLIADQGFDDIDSDVELADLSDSEEADKNEYDQLPPFKPLMKSQLDKLSKEQRKAYFEEYDYRVKLFERKQWSEEIRKLKEIKKKGKDYTIFSGYTAEDDIQEDGGLATVPLPMPDSVLPPSFDGDNPTYRYRSLEPTFQLLLRPVLESQGWDHDCGYNGVSIESNLAIAGKFPSLFSVQITKDKREFNIHLDSSVCTKHGDNWSSMAGFDIQTVGRQLAYIIRGETKFNYFKLNKTSTGLSVTLLGESIGTGLKIEDQIAVGKQMLLVGTGGVVRTRGDTAFGTNFEVCIKSKDFPVVQDQSSVGLSLMKWRDGQGVIVASLQSQFAIARNSKMAIRVGINRRRSGQITIKTTSSDLHIALIGLIPVVMSIFRSIYPGSGSRNLDVLDYQ